MRTSSLFRSAIAAATVTIGLAAGVASAAPPVDPNQILDNLTPEQLTCLFENVEALNTEDFASLMATFESCDIGFDQLLAIGAGTDDLLDPVESLATALETLGIDADAEVCIAASVAAGAPADDAAALTILQSCGVSLVTLVTNVGAAGAAVPGTDAPVGTDAPASGGNDLIIDAMVTSLATQYPNLDNTQLTCLAEATLENIETFTGEDTAAILAVLTGCGIALTDIM